MHVADLNRESCKTRYEAKSKWKELISVKSSIIYEEWFNTRSAHTIPLRKIIYYGFLVWKNSVRYYKIWNRRYIVRLRCLERHDKSIKCRRARKIVWPRDRDNRNISRNSRKIGQSLSIKRKIVREIKRKKYGKFI